MDLAPDVPYSIDDASQLYERLLEVENDEEEEPPIRIKVGQARQELSVALARARAAERWWVRSPGKARSERARARHQLNSAFYGGRSLLWCIARWRAS